MSDYHEDIILSPEDWDKFTAMLDSPPKASQALKDLMRRPSIWQNEPIYQKLNFGKLD